MTLTFSRSGPKVTKNLLHECERQLGCELPKDYQEFLLKHNGGEPSKKFFRFTPTNGEAQFAWIDEFLILDEHLAKPSQDVPSTTIAFVQHTHQFLIPNDCLCIGIVARDDLLLLRLRRSRKGQIDLKVPLELGPPLVSNPNWGPKADRELAIYPIAKTFSEFLDLLRETEDEVAT